MKLCVDASLVLKWLVSEEGSECALALLKKYQKKDCLFIAPSLLDYEIGSILRQKILRGFLSVDDLFPIYDFYHRLGLVLLHPTPLVDQTVSLAGTLSQSTIYDTSYLLLAKQQGVDFVTADKKFYQAARGLFPFVKFYEDLT